MKTGRPRNTFPKNNTYALSHGEARHGKRTKEYMAWSALKARCYNKKCPEYRFYGAKGIKVCDRWLNSFENFLADVGRAPSKDHSLDRYPNQMGNYEPSNCRWAVEKEQHRNKSSNKIFTINGVSKCVSAWAEHFGVDYRMVINRLYNGWSFEDAFFAPLVDCNKPVVKLSMAGEVLGEYKSISEAAKENNTFKTNISAVMRGRAKSCGGFKWALKNTSNE